MIRYDISRKKLAQAINAAWRAEAVQRTDNLEAARCYFEPPTGNWSKIKEIYMQLQHFKCAYCERPLAGHPYGKGEHAVEHFRPKRGVKAWPTPAICAERKLKYDFATGGDWAEGYYLLAYEPWNYATVCGICNTVLKGSYFPIAGPRRGPQTRDPRSLRREKPLLIYPIGKIDANPENLITFEGCTPKPRSPRKNHNYRRGLVTIDFFGLLYREELLEGRAKKIRDLWVALDSQAKATTPEHRTLAAGVVKQHTANGSEHASCARAYCNLFRTNRPHADKLFKAAFDYVDNLHKKRDLLCQI